MSRNYAPKDLIHSDWVKEKCENIAKEGSKRSLDSRKVDSAGKIVPFLHRLVVVPLLQKK